MLDETAKLELIDECCRAKVQDLVREMYNNHPGLVFLDRESKISWVYEEPEINQSRLDFLNCILPTDFLTEFVSMCVSDDDFVHFYAQVFNPSSVRLRTH